MPKRTRLSSRSASRSRGRRTQVRTNFLREHAGEPALKAAHEALKGAERLDALPLPNVSFDGGTLNRYVAEWMGLLR